MTHVRLTEEVDSPSSLNSMKVLGGLGMQKVKAIKTRKILWSFLKFTGNQCSDVKIEVAQRWSE